MERRADLLLRPVDDVARAVLGAIQHVSRAILRPVEHVSRPALDSLERVGRGQAHLPTLHVREVAQLITPKPHDESSRQQTQSHTKHRHPPVVKIGTR
jgi:hypothetical protein